MKEKAVDMDNHKELISLYHTPIKYYDLNGQEVTAKEAFAENKPSKRTADYWAINIDFKNLSAQEITKCVFTIDSILDENLNFVIERKQKNGNLHLHSYIKGNESLTETKLHKLIVQYFKGFSFKIKPVFDLNGWRNYMLKCSTNIIQTRPDEAI